MATLGRRDFTKGALTIGALAWLPATTNAALADPKKGGVLAYASVSGPGMSMAHSRANSS